jgi:flagellar assembly factor FliW
MWMQAVHDIHIRFVVLDPLFVADQYEPEIPDDVLRELDVKSKDTLRYFLIAVVPKDIKDMTVNLKSPVVVNSENNKAAQIILESSDYSVRHYLFGGNGVAD